MAHDPVVHLIDDDEGVRHSLAFLLTTSGFAVRVYASAQAFLDGSDSAQPGCVITDIRMPGLDGLELLRALNSRGAAFPVVVMTGHGDVPIAVEAMKAGAVDFLEKPFGDDVLLNAVRSAVERQARDSERDAEVRAARAKLELLSARERDVLERLIAGLPNKSIANEIGISPRTVEVHRAHVMSKMGVGSLSELVRLVVMTRAPSAGAS